MTQLISGEFWHYTCIHGRAELGGRGRCVPGRHRVADARTKRLYWTSLYGWFTTIADVGADTAVAIGLDRRGLLTCSRWAYRYRVEHGDRRLLRPWADLRDALPPSDVWHLEQGAQPSTWWLSTEPVRVLYDPQPSGGAGE